MRTFAGRCAKEILRDPINLAFGLGFPLVLLVLLTSLQSNIPVPLFEIDTLTPGIAVFGLSFLTLFSATLVARDRESAFLQRLYTTPLTGADFILGYLLPLLPIALGQTAACYLFAVPLGLTVNLRIVFAVAGILPMAVFNIALGLLFGLLLCHFAHSLLLFLLVLAVLDDREYDKCGYGKYGYQIIHFQQCFHVLLHVLCL